MPTKEFKVATVSSNTNDFGLYGMMLFARDGEVWEVAANSLHVKQIGDVVEVQLDEVSTIPDFTALSYEIPQRMIDCPQEIVESIWK